LDDISARNLACAACRQYLRQHADERLHPRQRTALGTIAEASHSEHGRAFLQHDVHGEAIVRFFLETFPGARLVPAAGLLLRVYTRWDSPALPVDRNSIVVCQEPNLPASVEAPHRNVLEMYNSTGTGYTGYHYDPLFSASSGSKALCIPSASSSCSSTDGQISPMLKATGVEEERSLNDDVDLLALNGCPGKVVCQAARMSESPNLLASSSIDNAGTIPGQSQNADEADDFDLLAMNVEQSPDFDFLAMNLSETSWHKHDGDSTSASESSASPEDGNCELSSDDDAVDELKVVVEHSKPWTTDEDAAPVPKTPLPPSRYVQGYALL